MAVRVKRDARIYHSPSCSFHDLTAGQIIEGDLANYLEANAPEVVEAHGSGPTLAEGATGPGRESGVGTDPVLTPDACASPLSYENALARAGAASFSPDMSLPPGTPDPVQLAQDGRSAMAATVPVTVEVDPGAAGVPGAGNPVRARTQVEGRLPSGSNIVSDPGSDEGAGVVVVPLEAQNAVLVEPVTGATVSPSAPLVEGAATPSTVVDGEQAGGGESAGVDVRPAPDAAESAGEFDPSEHSGPQVIQYAKDHPDQRERLLQAEREGKARSTVLNALD